MKSIVSLDLTSAASSRSWLQCLMGLLTTGLVLALSSARAQVVLNEIHYHPVEEDAFDAQGLPLVNLNQDVFEFIELYNAGSSPVSLSGWKLDSGVQFTFPATASIPGHGYLLVAKDPSKLAGVTEYGLVPTQVFGPYSGVLSNSGEEVRLKNRNGEVMDAVEYGTSFPWPASANAFGASVRWLDFKPIDWQYRGRSLERVSAAASSHDPGNWRSSIFPGNPTPGRINSVTTAGYQVRPIAEWMRITQVSTGTFPIASNQPARLEIVLSAPMNSGGLRVDYFVDSVNSTNEVIHSVTTVLSNDVYVASLPGFPGRSVVRYRVYAELDGGMSWRVVPHQDEFFGWNAYFAVPTRTSATPIYDLFISSNSVQQLARNLQDNPNNGWKPPLGTAPIGRFNNTEPGFLAYEGRVYDVEVRHSGSFYRRDAGRNSYKVEFPQYGTLNGHRTLLILDKGSENIAGHRIFEEAGFPTSKVRSVLLQVNALQVPIGRIEFEEHDDQLIQKWLDLEARIHPNRPPLGIGHLYKSSGVTGPPPFGGADGSVLPPAEGWTSLQRYEWVYSSKTMDWEGYTPLAQMLNELWAARGPGPGVNVESLRTYLSTHWDVDMTLDYLALRGWMAVQDDTYHNYFVWKRTDGKWTMLAWDFDAEMENTIQTYFEAENANWFKDSFFKAFRQEYIDRLWWLNNTFFHPDNLAAQGLSYSRLRTFTPARIDFINKETGKGAFVRPDRPNAIYPRGGESVVQGAKLMASEYHHPGTPALEHASTWWVIRTKEGSYRDPVYSVTNAGPSTQTAIPVDLLEPGRTYYWQCVYHDTLGRPSTPVQEASFVVGGRQKPVQMVTLAQDSGWRYHDQGVDLGRTWRPLNFDDSSWKTGTAPFGVSTGAPPIEAVTPLALGPRTYYFRHKFNMPTVTSPVELRLQAYVDDGAVFYVNGSEVYRINMPAFYPVGSVPFTALASREVAQPSIDQLVVLTLTNVVVGENILAIQVHQATTNSPDIMMSALLESTFLTPELTGVRLNEVYVYPSPTDAEPLHQVAGLELFNSSDSEQSLTGWTLTDDPLDPTRYAFPPGQILAPGEHRFFTCNALIPASSSNIPIALSPESGTVRLYQPDSRSGYLEVDVLTYGTQLPGLSLSRYPDGTGSWQLSDYTPGQPNEPVPIASPSVLSINEWMAEPTKGSDWIEVYNPSALAVPVGGLGFVDTLFAKPETSIPALSFLAPHSHSLFFADGNPDRGPLHLPYKLNVYGDRIILLHPSGVLIDKVDFGPQVVGVSWGRSPDGGASIQSFAGAATPGYSNDGDADQDGMPDAWERQNHLKPGIHDAWEDPDRDGLTNFEEFLAGTLPRNPTSVLRLEVMSEALGDAGLRMAFESVAGKEYQIERRSAATGGAWQMMLNVPAQSVSRPIVIDAPADSSGSQFYRVRLVTP